MIKRILAALLIALPMTLAAQKIAVVDGDAIMQVMPGISDVQTKLTEASQTYEQELARLQQELEQKYTELQQLPESTPDGIKERRTAEIQELMQRVDMFRQTASQDLQRQQMQLIQPIQEKLIQAIQSVGKTGGYTVVLPIDVPIYFDPAQVTDITADVKKLLGIN